MIADLFSNGGYWQSAAAVSPPPFFTDEVGYALSTDSAGVGDYYMTFTGDATILPGDYSVSVSVSGNPLPQTLYIVLVIDVAPFTYVFPMSDQLGTFTQDFTLPEGIGTLAFFVSRLSGGVYVAPQYMSALILPYVAGLNAPVLVNGGSSDYDRVLCYDAPVDYDSGRFLDPRAKTLTQLRYDIVARLGYAANATLPAGMATLVDSFINDANEQLFERYPVLRLQRWWTWQTQEGQRHYDVPIDCTDYLDLRHISQVWLQDDQSWFPLVCGINPALYNQTLLSLPQYYDLTGGVINLWPSPDKATYLLHLKGDMGPTPMVGDDDPTTVDSRAVFLHALANAKSHYQQPDAGRYDRQLEIFIGRLTAGSHATARYIPGEPPTVGLPLPIREVPGG